MQKVDLNNLEIEHDSDAHRWQAQIGEHLAVVIYRRKGDIVYLTSTEVPPELQGQGIASKLVQTALDDARARNLTVAPFCSFVSAFIRRHPEYQDLVDPHYSHLVERGENEAHA